jgi:tetratricopeptide (TPR) repeat protein
VDRKRLTVRLVIEKIPFVVLAALDSALTINAQAKIGAMVELTAIPWYSRLANAAVAYGSYIAKCFCPRDLAVYYPYHAHAAWLVAVCAAALVGITAFAWIGRERRPYVLVGWLWFVGTLVPVIGLVQVGGQAMADRYTYLPYLGVFIALVWRAADFAPNLPRRSLAIVTALSLGALATATEHQLRFWQNSGTLWTHTLAVTRDNVPAHLGLGYYYSKQPSRLADAIAEYREATRLAPNRADAHYSLGVLLARTRATRTEAIAEYQAAIRLDPTNGPAYFGLGMAAEQVPLGAPEAIAAYEAALAIDPKNADAHNRLGNLLASDPNRRAEAIEHFRAALASDPASAEVRLNLGAALAGAGRLDEAIAEYRELVRQRPDFADAHNNLANALLRVPGAASDAEAEYQTAIRLKPDFIEARFNYAQLLARVLGRPSDALAQLDEILRLRPDFAPARELAAELRR